MYSHDGVYVTGEYSYQFDEGGGHSFWGVVFEEIHARSQQLCQGLLFVLVFFISCFE